jgi:putative oxidoreductase
MSEYLTLKNLGWLFTVVVAVMLGMGGFSKIVGTEEMVGNFEYMKLSSYLLMVGVLEVLGVVLLVLPRTSLYGSVLIGSIMTAAVCMHLSLGFPGTEMPVLLGVLGFAGYKLRDLD